jgi:hypothetical protein
LSKGRGEAQENEIKKNRKIWEGKRGGAQEKGVEK